jgi:hypothetical protein
MRFKPAWIFCTGGRERRRKQAHRERQFGGIGAQNACFLAYRCFLLILRFNY